MHDKSKRDKLEDLLAAIHDDVYEAGSSGEVCLSPLLDASLDETENTLTSEGDHNDELFA